MLLVSMNVCLIRSGKTLDICKGEENEESRLSLISRTMVDASVLQRVAQTCMLHKWL